MTAGDRRRAYTGPAFLSHGFRPFFFLGSCFAALAIPLWLAAFAYGYGIAGDAMRWHAHEMLFGYLAAIVAGFLMTAIPNWTGRLPVMGTPLFLFVLVWIAGRIAMFIGDGGFVAAIDSAFLVLLAGFAWREVLRGKNWRNLPVCLFVSLFAIANILSHVEQHASLPTGIGERFGLGVAVMLMSLIGGRIIPSFTINWMKRRGKRPLASPFGPFDKAALLATGLATTAWIAAPDTALAGYALLAVGGLHLVRLVRWRGWTTFVEPLVAILHIAYAWLVAAFLAMGTSVVRPDLVTPSLALHVLTAGAIGQLTMAVMTRASLGHCGRALEAGVGTVTIYALIFLGAAFRVAGPFTPLDYALVMSLSGALWISGFLLFAILYGPMLFTPRRS
ncbi:NnrS family protein [Parasphingopyxis algicola]|nr:NnrS family protein [Parasphingopyxis algicola]